MEQKKHIQILHLNKTISIIGAGASGLFAAILLSKAGFNVVVFEKNHKPGRKLLATGNGKCNITNTNLQEKYFFSFNPSFTQYTLNIVNYKTIKKLFNTIGLEITTNDDTTKVYPLSLQASSVTNILYNEAKENNTQFVFDTTITDIHYENNQFYLQDNTTQYTSDIVIICSGSEAMPKLGSSNSGYEFAKKFGHNIITPFPSLVQLTTSNKTLHNIDGIKIYANITLYINNKQYNNIYGDILFRSYGVSGNAILDISRDVSYNLQKKNKIYIDIDLLPNISKEQLTSMLNKRVKLLTNKQIDFFLESIIPHKLIFFVYNHAKIDKAKSTIKQLTKKDILNIVFTLKHLKIDINGTKGIEYAEVVAGGIDTKQINPKTMQSKLQPNLYFCGEVMDVDGYCGGYNLHWAWSSAYICATNISKNMLN